MFSIKKRIRRWLFPEFFDELAARRVLLEEYDNISTFMTVVREATKQDLTGKVITVERPIAILGNLKDSFFKSEGGKDDYRRSD